MYLIINADDLGLSNSINKGIYDSFKEGITTSTTVIVNLPGFESALNLFKNEQKISIGLHFNATYGKPLGQNYKTLIDEKGFFKGKNETFNFSETEIEKELNIQYDFFVEKFQKKPSHIDSHHHIHHLEKFQEIFFNFCKKHNLPIRTINSEHREKAKKIGLKTPDIFDSNFYNNPSQIVIENIIKSYKDTDYIVELMTHPGYIDSETLKITSYKYMREEETKELIKIKKSKLYEEIKMILKSYCL